MPKAKASAVVGDVKHLMEMMVAHDVTEIDIEDGPRKIVLKRGSFAAAAGAPVAPPSVAMAPVAVPAQAPPAPAEEPGDLIEITSPMVGTFYAAPSPDSDPFTSSGASVTDNTVVCIIEAMKVMNEIKAECSGTVAEVCVKNAEPVEFGQVLFKVKPA
jgi:acetyl-CoA carboxylase biotin carboxyl carrier protein